ncbi:MAG: TonB-dependent receptor [Candidatus Acidiferrales bacterium]
MILGVLLAIAPAARAQQNAASRTPIAVTGIVQTEAGTPIPGATVRAENSTTHQRWVTWTDESGKFSFPGLPPGSYQLSSDALGFGTATLDSTFQSATPPPPPLTLVLHVLSLAEMSSGNSGAVVAAKPSKPSDETPPRNSKPVVAQQGAPTRTAQGQAAVQRQPGSGRRTGPAMAAGLANAMRQGMGGFQQVDVDVQGGGDSTAADQTPAAANTPLGAASSSDSLLLNGSVGIGANTFGPSFGRGGLPGSNLGVDLGPAPGQKRIFVAGGGGRGGPGGFRGGGPPGGGGGGIFIMQRFRAQVNRIHYGFAETYQNSAFNARPYSLTEANPPKIGYYNERLLFNAGGPLKIPHIYDGSDKTFFFANYSLNRQQSPQDVFSTVPTQAERGGNFCGVVPQLYDPFSNSNGPRTPLGCSIPVGMQDNAALGLLKYIPPANLPGTVQNYHLETTVPQSSDSVNIHILHTISRKFSVNGGYNFNSSRSNTLGDFLTLGGTSSSRNQNVDLRFVQTWSPRLTNNSSVNWSRSRIRILSDNSFVNDISGQLGIGGISNAPINFGIPGINFTNFTGLSDPIPSLVRNQTLRFNDTVTYVLPKHTITVGGEVRRMQDNNQADPIPRGQFNFTGLMTSQLDSSGQPVPGQLGVDFADFLLGVPQTTQLQFGSTNTYFRNWGFIGFAQDDWRIRPRFTFEFGLRYEVETPPIELFNKIANLDVNSDITQAQVVTPGQPGPFSGSLPRSLIRGSYNNWAPRFGMAWKPFAKHAFIVRSGYSIFYSESVYGHLASELANQPPWAQAQFLSSSASQFLTLENGFPAQPSQPSSGIITNTIAVDPNYAVPQIQIWDLGLEQQLPRSWVLDVTYTGTKGANLDILRAPNRLVQLNGDVRRIPNVGGFTLDQSGAESIYHALQVRLQKRMSRGLTVYGVYTFGKSLDDASSIGGGSPVVEQQDGNLRAEWGRSASDVRHQLRTFGVYELPFGPRQRWAHHGWQASLLGNYRLNVITTVSSGQPYTALGPPSDNTASGGGFSERANQIGDPCLPAGQRTPLNFFNTAAFVAPPVGTFGDASRNTICGPGSFSINAGLSKSMVFGKDQQRRMTLAWQVQNLTNTPNFSGLSTVVNSFTYGRVTRAGSMRTMNLSLRVNF